MYNQIENNPKYLGKLYSIPLDSPLDSIEMSVATTANDEPGYWTKFKARWGKLCCCRLRPSEPLNSTTPDITASCFGVQRKSLKSNTVTASVAEKNSFQGLRNIFGSRSTKGTNNSNSLKSLVKAVEPKKSMRWQNLFKKMDLRILGTTLLICGAGLCMLSIVVASATPIGAVVLAGLGIAAIIAVTVGTLYLNRENMKL